MNSSGWIRTIWAVNMKEEEFLMKICDTMGREFESEITVLNIMENEYLIVLKEYSTIINKAMIRKLKGPIGPYRLDKYILNDFQIQGFSFDKERSQYIRNVYL